MTPTEAILAAHATIVVDALREVGKILLEGEVAGAERIVRLAELHQTTLDNILAVLNRVDGSEPTN